MNENEVMKKEREAMKKSHLEALISEWKFQCAEGIYTYPIERMFEICYTDAYEQGRKEATEELQEEIDNLNGIVFSQGKALDTEYMINTSLKEQIEKMKRCGNCKNYKPCSHWCTNREFYRNWNCVCEDWEIKEND